MDTKDHMTGRQLNLLAMAPGTWIKGPNSPVLEFVAVTAYRRSKPEHLSFIDHSTGDVYDIYRWNLLALNYEVLESTDNRVKAIKVLYGRREV